MDRVHQVILNMIATKHLANKVFDYIYQWGLTLAYIACAIRAYYHHTMQSTPGQAVFGRDMIFNLTLIVDRRDINARKEQQVDIDNFRENAMRVTHDYAIGNLVYV